MQKTILVFGPEEDCETLEGMLPYQEYKIVRVLGFNGARKLTPDASAIVCEACIMREGDWKQVLEIAQEMSPSPAVIVCSKLADTRLWAEVLNLGGYDVLAKPFEGQEVARVMGLATADRMMVSAC